MTDGNIHGNNENWAVLALKDREKNELWHRLDVLSATTRIVQPFVAK